MAMKTKFINIRIRESNDGEPSCFDIDSARTLDYKQFKKIFEVKIRAGYNSKSPTATLRVHLTLGKGVQEWGAEPYKDYYILQILEVQKIENWSQEASK